MTLVDTAMDSDDELCASWTTQDMLQALFETLKQLGYVNMTMYIVIIIFKVPSPLFKCLS